MTATTPPVAIIMGSRSDWPTMKGAADALDSLGVAWEAKVVSAYSWEDAGQIGLLLDNIKSALLDRYEAHRARFGV